MPTENEFKFVLTKESGQRIHNHLNGNSKDPNLSEVEYCDGIVTINIRQGYLQSEENSGITLRLRESTTNNTTIYGVKITSRYYEFCYKQYINGRLIEIEKQIDERDFNDLWTRTQPFARLEKVRYVLNEWVVDYFYHNGEVYFAMAELELPEGKTPEVLPEFIKSNLVYAVPQNRNGDFSSKKLTDPDYGEDLYSIIADRPVFTFRDFG